MEKEEIIEKFKLACKNNIGGVFDIIRDCGFTITRNGNKNTPKMTVSYQNGIQQKLMTLSAYLPYEICFLLLEYMVSYYLTHENEDIFMNIDDQYIFDEEVVAIVDEINDKLENKMGKLLTQACKYM